LIDRLAITLHLDEFKNGVRELGVPALDMAEEVLFPLHESQLQSVSARILEKGETTYDVDSIDVLTPFVLFTFYPVAV